MADLKQFLDWGTQGIALAVLWVLFVVLKMNHSLELKRMELDEKKVLADRAMAEKLALLAERVEGFGG